MRGERGERGEGRGEGEKDEIECILVAMYSLQCGEVEWGGVGRSGEVMLVDGWYLQVKRYFEINVKPTHVRYAAHQHAAAHTQGNTATRRPCAIYAGEHSNTQTPAWCTQNSTATRRPLRTRCVSTWTQL